MLSKLRSGVVTLLRSESGIAMPTVLTVTVISLGFGSVAAVSAISAQRGSVRDLDTKAALAAAEAGAERAMYRYNKLIDEDNLSLPCLTASGGLVGVGSDGWCPAVTGSVGDATYSYQVRPTVISAEGIMSEVEIVSTGNADGVARRINIGAQREDGFVFAEHTVIGLDGVHVDSDSTITGGTASNDDVSVDANGLICGNVQYGPGHGFTGDLCPGYTATDGTLNLPEVDQGDVQTVNSNTRFFTQDTRSPPGRVRYDSSARTLTLNSNSSLTLGGSNYSLCRLIMGSNTDLYVANGATVRIYFDSPENCNLPNNTAQLQMDSNARIQPTAGGSSSMAMLFVGSETMATRAILSSNTSICELRLIVYGPNTDILLNSNTHLCGAVAGETIEVDSNVSLQSSPDNQNFELPVPLHFKTTRYVECGQTGTTPDASC
jgi:hypothetical protein